MQFEDRNHATLYPSMQDLIQQGWSEDPLKRPTAAECLNLISEHLRTTQLDAAERCIPSQRVASLEANDGTMVSRIKRRVSSLGEADFAQDLALLDEENRPYQPSSALSEYEASDLPARLSHTRVRRGSKESTNSMSALTMEALSDLEPGTPSPLSPTHRLRI